jgi:hypothetical protein
VPEGAENRKPPGTQRSAPAAFAVRVGSATDGLRHWRNLKV